MLVRSREFTYAEVEEALRESKEVLEAYESIANLAPGETLLGAVCKSHIHDKLVAYFAAKVAQAPWLG